MKFLKVSELVLVTLVMAAASAWALEKGITYQSNSYITGGIGEEERLEMDEARKQYNFWLMTAEKSGAYIADAEVSIFDGRDAEVLNVIMQGPFLFANLNPGRYTIHVSSLGERQSRSFKITSTAGVELNLYFSE